MKNWISADLGLRAGEWVVVRAKEEILDTLDESGCLDGLILQPEMFGFCGKRLRVYKAAHKTCDTVTKTGGRRMERTVHLEGIRCDGGFHGGCQADCLLFWKEAWLKRAGDVTAEQTVLHDSANGFGASEEIVLRAVRPAGARDERDAIWRCQATGLLAATKPLHWWDMRQYVRDVTSGNHRASHIAKLLTAAAYRKLIGFGHGYRALVWLYNIVQRSRGGAPYSTIIGEVPQGQPTPAEALNLHPGEWVEVKSVNEIQATISWGTNRNRGMLFDKEMAVFCGTRQQVKGRVDRIIDERTGRMISMKTPCIELSDAHCRALCSEKRLGCPRSIPSYWREIWLRRIPSASGHDGSKSVRA